MNIVIVHCHFERGGVTQVVENHVGWLSQQSDVDRLVLVSGNRVGGLGEATRARTESVQIPAFDYDSLTGTTSGDLESRVDGLIDQWNRQMRDMNISPADSVIHWHNHSLGKNAAAPRLIARLANEGWRLLLQIHDFAEDNRPENYRHLIEGTGAETPAALDALLYPVASQIHYATLTQFDAGILSQLGIPEEQTHCLPNSVTAPSDVLPDHDDALRRVRKAMNLPADASWCLYPVRGIRRKNVGELLLLSRMTRDDCYTGLTLRPTTPVEQRSYDRWRDAAKEYSPRTVFDAAHHADISFADNLAASQFVVSTSVAEGFGMAFLEPWLARREVIARRLASVSDDFEASGVQLPKLYDSLNIPGTRSWIEQCHRESFAMFRDSWRSVPERFHPESNPPTNDDADSIDFAQLTPETQLEVLRRVASDHVYEATVQAASEQLIESMHEHADGALLDQNETVVGQQYSLGRTGSQLQTLYATLLAAPVDPACNGPSNAGQAVQLIHHARPLFPCRMESFDAPLK